MSLFKFYKKIDEQTVEGDNGNQHKHKKVDLSSLPVDPAERPSLDFYHVNQRDEIRRSYLQKGPFQPEDHKFPQRPFGAKAKLRRFKRSWFVDNEYWLEYSIKEDAAFCLCCYLFKSNIPNQGGSDHFVKSGFKCWNRKSGLKDHKAGDPHNIVVQKCQDLMNQRQSISSALEKQTALQEKEYRIRLNASIDCVRFLLHQGLAFRGHNEKEDWQNKGNFLELLQWLADRCDEVHRVVLKNAPKNTQLTCSDIQKDIVQACSSVALSLIMKELGKDFFAILVNESRDVSCKEQMALVLRFVNKKGEVVERFVGLRHVSDTSALSLKATIYDMLKKWNLSHTMIRGQGYDGASNMSGTFNGELESGTGLNQEVGIKRPCDTRWGSHFASLLNIKTIYPSICEVLVELGKHGSDRDHKAEALRTLKSVKSFDFVFCLHLMVDILGVTNHLNTSLQRKDQDIVNAMNQVSCSKKAIQEIRDVGWETLLGNVTLFCDKYEVRIIDMEDEYYDGFSRRKASHVNNLHHYHIDLFKEVVDMQLQELNHRFNEANTKLLLCIACLCPRESFKAFDLDKLKEMATLYQEEFPTEYDLQVLEVELKNYVRDVREDERFNQLNSIGELTKKMVEKQKHIIFPKVYLLLKLALILPQHQLWNALFQQ